jgi:pyruvate,water dikinase
LENLSDKELVEYARKFIPMHRAMFDDHVLTSSNTATGPTVLGQIVPDLMVRIIAGAGDVDSAAPSHAMWALSRLPQNSPEFQQGFDDFLYEFGSRGPNEWDIYSDVWETKPELALAMIDSMRQVGPDGDPAKKAAEVVVDSAKALAEALERVKGNEEATTMVNLAATSGRLFNSWRERSKTNCIRVMNEARVAMRELGRRHAANGALAHEKQVFMLLNDELDAFVADPKSFTAKLAERETQWRSLWLLETPYFVEGDRHVPEIEELPKRIEVKVEPVKTGDVLQGNAGCSGVVRGRARVILDPSDPSALEFGDILIAPNTDPAWTPLFIPAGGVVVDVGALNSHSIIVSRELGIPCVVSVVNATRRIPDGAMIEVNGDLGTVTIL